MSRLKKRKSLENKYSLVREIITAMELMILDHCGYILISKIALKVALAFYAVDDSKD